MVLVIHKALTAIIFGVPTGLFLISIFIISMVNGSNLSSAVGSVVSGQDSNSYIFSFDIGIALAIFFGLLTVAFAIWFGFADKLRDFLTASKKSEVDQKIAMIYNFAQEFRIFRQGNKASDQLDLVIERILSDIRGVGRIKSAIKDEQKERLIVAKNRLLTEMRQGNYNQEANRVEEVFGAHLW